MLCDPGPVGSGSKGTRREGERKAGYPGKGCSLRSGKQPQHLFQCVLLLLWIGTFKLINLRPTQLYTCQMSSLWVAAKLKPRNITETHFPGWGKSLSPLSIANSSFWKSNIFHATNENIVTGCTAVTVMCFTLQGRPTLEECMLDVTGEMAKQWATTIHPFEGARPSEGHHL